MTEVGAWSYSRIKNFETCPKQYYHVKVLGEFPFEGTAATQYGTEFHTAAENFIRNGEELPGKFVQYAPLMETLRARPGEKHCELKMGLTKDLEPCGFFDAEVWFRGIVDLLMVDGTTAYVVDYKTGKSARYADPDQLELMALATFAHFPQIEEVKAGLLFVIADEFIRAEYAVSSQDERWARWYQRHAAIEKAHESGVFNPRPSGLCRAHCPVLECAHNGQS